MSWIRDSTQQAKSDLWKAQYAKLRVIGKSPIIRMIRANPR